ncbi:MAG: LicD family protein [Treponema sp.]|jgi:lipopolysaccharide cholinephosphotransferase|nr:LicD family protein [Treponema sp.]
MMYLDKDSLRKLQLSELIILIEVKRICEKHKINYFLIGGTLIGAVRHKGFIPWDDDIDIGMLRDDFDKFVHIVNDELGDNFYVQSGNGSIYSTHIRLKNTKYKKRTDANLPYTGISIDILAYDIIPENNCKAFLYCYFFSLLIRNFYFRLGVRPRPANIIYRIILYLSYSVFFFIPTTSIKNKLERYYLKYVDSKSKYRMALTSRFGFPRQRHLHKTLSQLGTAVFEGIELPIPADYHTFLTEQYGDYMKLPPVEKQIPLHDAIELDFGPYR